MAAVIMHHFSGLAAPFVRSKGTVSGGVFTQTVNLVLDTIRLAMHREKKRVAAELQLHSDQGFQYTSQAYFNLTKEYGITPSMSRRGNPYDNAMAENFFSILKTECICQRKRLFGSGETNLQVSGVRSHT